jgi:hypothetical protein
MTETFGGGKGLGTSILTGALSGAAGAAFGYALNHGVFSQADVAQQGGRDRSDYPFSSDRPAASSRVTIGDADGSSGGSVDVIRYRNYRYNSNSDDGAEILLGYKSASGGSCKDPNWVQTVETNSLTNGRTASPFIDSPSVGDEPYYYSAGMAAKVAGRGGYDTQFFDNPYRATTAFATQPNVQWSAQVSLVCGAQSDPLITFSWGFSTNATGGLSLQPLSVVSPSPFHLGALP